MAQAGYAGIDALRDVAFGFLGPAWMPTSDWQLFLSATGAFSFLYPPGWNVSELGGVGQLGAWLTAPDQSSAMGAYNLIHGEAIDARDSAWRQVDQFAGGSAMDVLYDEARVTLTGTEAFVAVLAGDYIMTVHTIGTWLPDGASVNYSVQIGAAAEFDTLAGFAFLPFVCQFLGGGCSGDDCPKSGGDDDDDDDDDDDEG
jgi:hypothetical protein